MFHWLIAPLIVAATAPVPAPDDTALLDLVDNSFSSPLFVTAPEGDPRLFVVERGGEVKLLVDDRVVGTYLDAGSLLPSSPGNEQGLLGLAFHPDFSDNGQLYLSYTDTAGRLVVSEVDVDPEADSVSISNRNTVIRIDQFAANHNGGMVLFGPDRYLYLGVGDGGGSGDPQGNGQNINTLLGAILRVNVDADGFPGDSLRNYSVPSDNPFVGRSGADEIWVYGLRNPWRFWIDEPTGRLYIADVGQNAREEVTILEPGSEGANLGWNRLEGTRCYPSGGTCQTAGTVLPQVEYDRGVGQSVTGGMVYRGSRIPALRGTYFYGDFVSGWVRSFRYDGSVRDHYDWRGQFSTSLVSSFGVDGLGEMYVVSLSGSVWRIISDSPDGDEMFFYRNDGLYRYYDIRPDAGIGSPIRAGSDYTSGWSSITSVNTDGDGNDEMFFYRNDGLYRFYDIRSDAGLGSPIRSGDDYTSGWDAITAVDLDGDGQDEMFFYRDDGLYRFYDIGSNGRIGSPIRAGTDYTSGWDAITAVDLDGDGQDEMFFYRDDGLYRYYDVRANASLGTPIRAGTDYTTGWANITSVEFR
jgi:glucose/arabinose dehydrogenase